MNPRIARILGVLVACALLIAGLGSPAEAGTVRNLGIAASPTTALVKSSVTVSGKLTKSPRGTVIQVQRKVGSRWVKVASTRTTSTAGPTR